MEKQVHLTIRFLKSPQVYGARIPEWIDKYLKSGALGINDTKNGYVKRVISNILSFRYGKGKETFDIEDEMLKDMDRWWYELGSREKGKMKTPCFSRYLNQILEEYFGGKNG